MRTRWTLLGGALTRRVAWNTGARVAAVVGLALATVVVGRVGGPEAVGTYALLRMLPGLAGVLCVAGLPGALAFFLAEPRRADPRLWPTVLALSAAGAALGTAAWCLATPLLGRWFFPGVGTSVLLLAGTTVATQLVLTIAKTALQGLGDRVGGDAVIAAEEVAFLPCYVAVLAVGSEGAAALVLGLALADLLVGLLGWHRVAETVRRHTGWPLLPWRVRPSRTLGRRIVGYGMRGQVGGIVLLLNLRLDFALLDALAGPAVLGTYAVASKYAELLRLPGTALTWVSYPELAAASARTAALRARRLVKPSLVGVWLLGVPLLLGTGPVMGVLYGSAFAAAVPQARVLFLGMLLAGAAGVASGYLYGRGRPGLNSLAPGAGLALTVALDLLLIPRYGAMGAAWASTCAYLVADGTTLVMLVRLTRRVPPEPVEPASPPRAAPVAP